MVQSYVAGNSKVLCPVYCLYYFLVLYQEAYLQVSKTIGKGKLDHSLIVKLCTNPFYSQLYILFLISYHRDPC